MRRVLLSLTFLLFTTVGAGAFTFTPISQEFTLEGKYSSHVFTLTNDSLTEKIAVLVTVKKRVMDRNGAETLEDCPGDFAVFPSRNILEPGAVKRIRIKWTGGILTDTEASYRVIAEQLPVEFQEEEKRQEGGGIRFTYRYEGSLYVMPDGVEPQIELTGIEQIQNEEGEAALLKLTFSNTGGRHAILGNLAITLISRYENFEPLLLEGERLKGAAGENILARSERDFLIPIPPQVKGEELLWEMTYRPIY